MTSDKINAIAARHAQLRATLKRIHTRPRTRPKRLLRRTTDLLRALDLFCPNLVHSGLLPVVEAIAEQEWKQPLWTWRGGGYKSLMHHLLITVQYPLPGFLFIEPGPQTGRYATQRRTHQGHSARLLAHLGGGGSMRQARSKRLIPHCMTRRMDHVLLLNQVPMPLEQAVRAAQVQVLGGPEWLVGVLLPTRLGVIGDDTQETANQLLIGWFCQHGDSVPRDQFGQVVDWWMSLRPTQRVAALRRGAAEVIKASRAWHQGRYRRPTGWYGCPPGPLPRTELQELKLQLEDGVWELKQVRSGEQLAAEGRAMRHCVATYHRLVMARTSVIFSLQKDGGRRLTVEVRPSQGSVVQAKGVCNRRAAPPELRVLRRWASVNGLRVTAT